MYRYIYVLNRFLCKAYLIEAFPVEAIHCFLLLDVVLSFALCNNLNTSGRSAFDGREFYVFFDGPFSGFFEGDVGSSD